MGLSLSIGLSLSGDYGGGSGPALPVSLPVAPMAFYGTGLMSGYAGSCAKVTKSTLATQNIGFAANRLDMSAAELFCGGVNSDCRITTLFDQSGNGNDMVQATFGAQPRLYRIQAVGAAQPMVAGPNIQMTIPSSVSVDRANHSVFLVMRTTTSKANFYWTSLGNSFRFGTQSPDDNPQGGMRLLDTANTVTKLSSVPPQSNVAVLGYSSGASGVSYYVDRKIETVAGAFASGTLTGGVWENGNGYSEMFALVIFPRALTPAEMSQVGLALEAVAAPNISPTIGVIFNGDSLTAGQGSSVAPANGLGWWWNEPRQFQLALPDPSKIMLFNFGQPSEPIIGLNADKTRIFPALMAAYPTISKWIVRHHGGINDLRGGSTDTQIITAISQLNAYTKSLGMKTFASTVVAQGNIAPWTAQMETYRQSVNASVLANWATYADGVIDYTSLPQMQDPTNLTYFTSDQLHHTSAGYQAEAALSESIMAPFI